MPDTLAARLRRLMTEAGLSAAELARRAGRHPMTVRKVLDGSRPDPRWSLVCDLARALGVRTDALRNRPESPP